MISGLFFFNYKGDVLISRIYRTNDVGYDAHDWLFDSGPTRVELLMYSATPLALRIRHCELARLAHVVNKHCMYHNRVLTIILLAMQSVCGRCIPRQRDPLSSCGMSALALERDSESK